MTGHAMQFDRLRDIAERYDAFFLDQFGVVHDGTAAYPGAPEAVAALAGLGKPVLFVTNSGRRAASISPASLPATSPSVSARTAPSRCRGTARSAA